MLEEEFQMNCLPTKLKKRNTGKKENRGTATEFIITRNK